MFYKQKFNEKVSTPDWKTMIKNILIVSSNAHSGGCVCLLHKTGIHLRKLFRLQLDDTMYTLYIVPLRVSGASTCSAAAVYVAAGKKIGWSSGASLAWATPPSFLAMGPQLTNT